MSKTAKEIMEKHRWIFNPFSKDLVQNMLEEYADQRVSEALNEYKEKLKGEIEAKKEASSNLYASITFDRILDLISPPLNP